MDSNVRLQHAELICLTCWQNNLSKALWSCCIWKVYSSKAIGQIQAWSKNTQKNKSQTHLCSSLHTQTMCCINFLEWPQVIKEPWCNCTNFISRIAFIPMCLWGVNLKITREHALTKGSFSLKALNSSVLFVIKGLFDLDSFIFKGQKPDSGHVLLCAHWMISPIRNRPWNYSFNALCLKCRYCVCAQCWPAICLHAMSSVACATAPLLSEKLCRFWVKCLAQDNCTEDCSFICIPPSAGL